MRAARITVGDTAIRYVELRMVDGRPAGIIEAAGRFARFDPVTGEITGAGFSARTDPDTPKSQRNTWKHLHRMTGFGHAALYINVATGIGLSFLIVTGSILYFKMLRTRSRSKVANPFWAGGGAWRTWHRRISIVAAVFLAVVTLSGLWLAYESLVFGAYFGSAQQQAETRAFAEAQRARAGSPSPPRPDPMAAESEPGRLNSLQDDLLLTDAEMVSVKTVLDASAANYAALSRTGTDSAAAQASAIDLHQREAAAVLAVLPERSRLQYGAWREAQRLGQPVPAAAGAREGQQRSRGTNAGASGPADPASPLVDNELPDMLRVTLNAERSRGEAIPLKVVRLRYYAGVPQGVLVTGGRRQQAAGLPGAHGAHDDRNGTRLSACGFPFWLAGSPMGQGHSSRERVRPPGQGYGHAVRPGFDLSLRIRSMDLSGPVETKGEKPERLRPHGSRRPHEKGGGSMDWVSAQVARKGLSRKAKYVLVILFALAGLPGHGKAAGYASLLAVKPVISCEQLLRLNVALPGGTRVAVNSATLLTTEKGVYCSVAATVAPNYTFQGNLPVEHWTQRFLMGAAGQQAGSCIPALNGEFAVAGGGRHGARQRRCQPRDPPKQPMGCGPAGAHRHRL